MLKAIVRDVLCARPPRILHSEREAYATCSLLGAAVHVAGMRARMPPALTVWAAFGGTVLARYIAWTYDIRHPSYLPEAPPPRTVRRTESLAAWPKPVTERFYALPEKQTSIMSRGAANPYYSARRDSSPAPPL